MKKLLLVALCSMPLLSVARGEEGKTKSGDAMQQGDAMKPGDKMGQESGQAKKAKAKKAKKKSSDTMMQGDGMKHDEKMGKGDKMEQGGSMK
jgi:hypothetical protein